MKFLAIDGNSLMNRAFYAIKAPLTNKDGIPTGAVFGFMNVYLKIFSEIKPDSAAVAFDMRKPTFRHKSVSTYKANRKKMPDELAQQMPIIKNLLNLMGIKVVECEGYEADDILGTLSKMCSDSNNECFVLTGDKDCFQLIDEKVKIIFSANVKTDIYDCQIFIVEYGFEPINLIDFKALMGDSSDNISGVAGIGKKTAETLIREYKTIENLYEKFEGSDLSKGVKSKLDEGRESAKESKWLATIVRDVPIDNDLNNYKISSPDNEGISKLLTSLEMFKLMEKMNIAVYSPKVEEEEYNPIEPKISELDENTISSLAQADYIFRDGKLSVRDRENIYTSSDENIICLFFESECEKSTVCAKPHYRWALIHNTVLKNLKTDIEICGYLLNSSAVDYAVDKLCGEYGIHYCSENGEYADLVSIKRLSEKLRSEIENQGMTCLLKNIEMPLTEVLASMEHHGITINQDGVKKFGEKISKMTEEITKEIYEEAGHEFNISSPKQLGVVLFEEMGLPAMKKTKSGYSTNAEALEELRGYSPIIENVLKYRQYTKLTSTYVTGLLDKVSSDGKIHTSFRQTETRTGRISSTEPNMQNIPVRTELGSQMRKFFTAEKGKILVDADYSQIELRVMAHLCGDKNMTEAFLSGEDIHTQTASQVFDMPAIMVTPEMRSAAKAVNFGIIYGIGAFSLSKDIGVTLKKAKQYIKDYLAKYPKVDEFMTNTVKNAEETGIVTTMFGRKRRIPEILSSNKVAQAAGKRIAMNTPVQGTAADLIKIAMINVYKRLKAENLNAELILQVHDELIIESDISCAERCAEILREEMQNVHEMKVPLVVDVNTGESWYDAKG